MTKKYSKSPDVVFGDVVLQKTPIKTIHGVNQSPGAGGWPTIRYFNKQTGYGGAPYEKRFDGMAMCDELGKKENMEEYIVNFGGASLCSVETLAGCQDVEAKVINDFKGKSASDIAAEIGKIEALATNEEDAIAKLKKSQEDIILQIKDMEENVKQHGTNVKLLKKIADSSGKTEL